MAYLLVLQGAHAGAKFELFFTKNSIGRGNKTEIRLEDGSVSRNHATIHRRPDGSYYIEDDGSTYGTFINGKKEMMCDLADKAHIKLGGAVFVFHLKNSSEIAKSTAAKPEETADDDTQDYTILQILSGDKNKTGDAPEQSSEAELIEQVKSLNRRLQIAYEFSAIISTTYNLNELYKNILRVIFNSVKAQRGSIMFVDSETGALTHQASLDCAGHEDPLQVSHTIVQKVIDKGESLLLRNAQSDHEFDPGQSIFALNIRSAMCAPLRTQDKIIGVITVDASGESFFTEEDLQLLSLVGNQAGIVIENARLIEQNIRSERLAAVGQTVASLAHCIKNILQGLKGSAALLDQGMDMKSEEVTTLAWNLVKSSQQRIGELALNMLDYSKERKPACEIVSLEEHMKNIFDLMQQRAKEKKAAIFFDYDKNTPLIECDSMGIYRATLNLVANAIDAVEADQGLISLKVFPNPDFKSIVIQVQDNGGGIPDEVKDKLFDAFHSTKDSKGTGLGLAVSRKIAHEHQGEILVETEPGKGTEFSIILPVHQSVKG